DPLFGSRAATGHPGRRTAAGSRRRPPAATPRADRGAPGAADAARPVPVADAGAQPALAFVLAGGGVRRRHRGPRARVGAGRPRPPRAADPPAAVAGLEGGPAGDPRLAGLHRGDGGGTRGGGAGPQRPRPRLKRRSGGVKHLPGKFPPLPGCCMQGVAMSRVPAFALALCLGLASSLPAAARGPVEDLRTLPPAQRVELIEREYAAQSRGRAIPDDQLAFYLEQVERGWGMGQVRADISGSLRGQGNRRWNGSSWAGATVVCSSNERRRRECRTPFNGRPVLVENISGTRCIEGRNFGGGGGTMWVDDGCRGRFAEGRGGWNGGGTGELVRCESQDNKRRTCAINGRAVLVRQLSKTACVEGRTWGQRGNSLWEDDGR